MESCLTGGSILGLILLLVPLVFLARISHWCHKTYEQSEYIGRQLKWLIENEQKKAGTIQQQ